MFTNYGSLEIVSGLCEQYVPLYERNQFDPVEAALSGIGNCFAKSVIGAIILKDLGFKDLSSEIMWSNDVHPQESKNLLGERLLLAGHCSLVVTNARNNRKIGIGFNASSRKADAVKFFDYAPAVEYVAIQTHKSWYQAGLRYAEALEVEDSSFHVMSEQEIREIVIDTHRSNPIHRIVPGRDI